MWNGMECVTTVIVIPLYSWKFSQVHFRPAESQLFLPIGQVVASMTIYLHNQLRYIGHLLGFQSPSSNE